MLIPPHHRPTLPSSEKSQGRIFFFYFRFSSYCLEIRKWVSSKDYSRFCEYYNNKIKKNIPEESYIKKN